MINLQEQMDFVESQIKKLGEDPACENCGSDDWINKNSSGDLWCENCGWDEGVEGSKYD